MASDVIALMADAAKNEFRVPVRWVGDFTHRKLVAFHAPAFWPVIE